MDAAGRLGGNVTRDAAGEGELPEEATQPVEVARDARVDLGVGPFEVGVRDDARTTVSGTGDEDRVQVASPNDAIHVGVDEVESRRRAEVAEQPRLDVPRLQWLAQQGVVEEVDLSYGEVVRRAPVGIDQAQLICPGRGLAVRGRRRRVVLTHARHSDPSTQSCSEKAGPPRDLA